MCFHGLLYICLFPYQEFWCRTLIRICFLLRYLSGHQLQCCENIMLEDAGKMIIREKWADTWVGESNGIEEWIKERWMERWRGNRSTGRERGRREIKKRQIYQGFRFILPPAGCALYQTFSHLKVHKNYHLVKMQSVSLVTHGSAFLTSSQVMANAGWILFYSLEQSMGWSHSSAW